MMVNQCMTVVHTTHLTTQPTIQMTSFTGTGKQCWPTLMILPNVRHGNMIKV